LGIKNSKWDTEFLHDSSPDVLRSGSSGFITARVESLYFHGSYVKSSNSF